jgi:hypothetical protein
MGIWNWLLKTGVSVSITKRFSWTGYSVSNWKYFSNEEVERWQLVPELWSKLDMLRENTKTILFPNGIPVIITSGRRSKDGNSILKGAVSDSSHLTGEGCDVHVQDATHYFALLKGAYAAGFRRIGHYYAGDTSDQANLIPIHLHLDIDLTKQQDCAWCKKEQN